MSFNSPKLHITEGCRLEGNRVLITITAYTGSSVLLPCSCTDLHTKPQRFTWKRNVNINTWVQISPESEQYKDRFQLFNDHSSGNLSLLISHLTVEDGGYYRCDTESEYRDIRLTVEGCRLEGNRETIKQITAYTGDSVLLPCSCTDLHTKPQRFTWEKYINTWVQISPESEQYKGRFQLVNDHSSGNLSLLISHLTVEDGGYYRCNTESEHRDIRLTVEGCTLNHGTVDLTGYVGHSVLLPCFCSQLQAKPQTFRWIYYKGSDHKQIFPKDQTNHYTHRVQLFNDHPPGNLSLLISHLTVEDGGFYRCDIINNNYKDIKLTVREAPKRPSPSTTTIQTTADPESPDLKTIIIISSGVVVVLLLMIIFGGVKYRKHKRQRREQMSEGQTGRRTQQQKQNDSAVLYASFNRPPEDTKAEEKLHITEGCRLEGNRETKEITGYTGDSVLLPCSCTDLHTKPQIFTWEKETYTWVQISPESEQYKDRFQLVNDHSSGNLSLLISHLTVEDGGFYRCDIINSVKDIKLTVREAPKRPSPSTTIIQTTAEPAAKPGLVTKVYTNPQSEKAAKPCLVTKVYTNPQSEKESLPYFPFAVVTVICLHIIVAVVYCPTKKKVKRTKCDVITLSFISLRLHITDGCRLEGNRKTTKQITAYTGDSVLLPCSCTDLYTKPQNFTWEKYINTWVQISPESEQYKDRFQLVNDHSSGNLSLLISHLTVEDGGYYRCNTESEHRVIRLTVKGCRLNHNTVDVTGYLGHSVLLPCSCSQLQAKPQTLTWSIYKKFNYKEIFPKDQTNHYTHRVQLFNVHHPGNLSLLISHLTVEDGGFYRCDIINSVDDIKLTVREAPKRPSPSTTIQTTAKPAAKPGLVTKVYTNPQSEKESLPYFPFAVVTVIFLHIIVAVVYCSTKKKGPNTVHYSRGDGDGTLHITKVSYNKSFISLRNFTWEKETNTRVQISPESEQYKDRFQLVNDHSSGNLSLLISHLTVEDGGYYRCNTESEHRYIRLTVEGCTLNHETVDVTGYVGHSVLLPCSCSQLQAKPQTLTWTIYKESNYKEIFPKDQTNHYTHRVQLFNDHPPGNLSLLISHLTVEDEGFYRCDIINSVKDIKLTVRDATPEKPDSNNIIISCGVVVVLLLLLIVGGVMYWKHRGQRREQMGEGQTGQKTQKKQDLIKPLNSNVTSEPTSDAVHEHNDSAVLYALINRPPKDTKAEEKDDVTYSTVVHKNTPKAALPLVESEDTTVYASIKTN
ncbi:hypothetical protein C0J45_16275 [Silurus meridionalis]|nr:hypothetical protein C0J45_16275 [Silurus meridionalis]